MEEREKDGAGFCVRGSGFITPRHGEAGQATQVDGSRLRVVHYIGALNTWEEAQGGRMR